MKPDKTVLHSDDVSLESSQLCCLARVNALLKSLRATQERTASARRLANYGEGDLIDDETYVPTPRELYVAELEASVAPEYCMGSATADRAIAHDSPRELARARLVFAATLVVPLLLVATGLAVFGAQLGRASTSLLQFSALVLATPLVLGLTRSAFRSGWQGIRRHPLLSLAGVLAASGYAGSAFAMTGSGVGNGQVYALPMAGLLVLGVQFARWLLAQRASAE